MMHCDGKQRKTMETIVYCVFVYLRTIETKESEMVGKFWRENHDLKRREGKGEGG